MAASNLFRQYYELAKPERTFANIITASAGFLFAAKWHVHYGLLISTLLGTTLVIASACVLNNFFDQGIDAHMKRTKKRVLVKGLVSSRAALMYGIALGVLGFLLLIAYVNILVAALGAVAYIDYVVLYGLSKRRSVYGTAVGTISGGMSIAAGYVAVQGRIDGAAILLFIVLACWQMPHFYAIAIYRSDDYRRAGIPVWPIKRGIKSTKQQMLLFTIAFIVSTMLMSVLGYTGYLFAAVMAGLGIYWLLKCIQGFKATDDATWARGMFSFSLVILLVFCAVLAASPVLP